MNVFYWTAVACLLAVGTGCGNICDRLNASTQSISDKRKNCSNSSASSSFDLQKCNTGMAKCSSDDLKQLDAYAGCLDRIAPCESGQELSFDFAVLGCYQPLSKLSATCFQAVQ